MENKIAKIFSYIFHPILIPAYIFSIILYLVPYLSVTFTHEFKLMVIGIVLITTCIIPLILFSLFYKLNLLESLLMETKEERTLPLLLISISYYTTYYIFRKLNLPPLTTIIMLSACISSIITLLINYKWKISIHCVGWGSFTGLMIGIFNYYMITNISIIISLFFISGLVAYSRLQLKAHNYSQVYAGYIIGFLSMLLIIH
ncbi:MAG: hypothetical protein Q8880_02245 [Bacteroidota bacterium]|nr:hypothetical protein [Bacteroidota bacterium]